jgi:hypothetical protein
MNILKIKNNKNFVKTYLKIFYFVTSNIKYSIFKELGFNFFADFLKINCNNSFYIEYNKKIISYISYIDSINEKKLKNLIIKFIIKNPFILLLILFKNINFLFKFHNPPKNYLQLMHLVINSKNFKNIFFRKKLHHKINQLNNKICKLNNFRGIYAVYQRNNSSANKYYKKNKYILYDQNFFFNFVKKKIK